MTDADPRCRQTSMRARDGRRLVKLRHGSKGRKKKEKERRLRNPAVGEQEKERDTEGCTYTRLLSCSSFLHLSDTRRVISVYVCVYVCMFLSAVDYNE